MRTFFITLCALTLLSLFSCKENQNLRLSDKVNPFIGTDGHGHTYPGAIAPFGMMQLSPDTRLDGWDGCGGYHYSDSKIYGFSHTHLSGTGCSDYADVLLLPISGKIVKDSTGRPFSNFKHKNEKANAGYYQTYLDDYNTKIELTATPRCGMHRYTFENKDNAQILIDLAYRDVVLDAVFNQSSPTEIEGYRFSMAWAANQKLYFVIQFSQPIKSIVAIDYPAVTQIADSVKSKQLQRILNFDLKKEEIIVKIGISAVSIEGARNNLSTEIPDWDFNKVKEQTQTAWDKELGKIEVKGGSLDQQKTFYTALYHSMSAPNLFMDVDGKYLGRDMQIHTAEGFDYYTVFSLWDTYRAEHPLMSIIDQKRTKDYINTFIAQFQQAGLLPVWELWANETNCMIGNHAIPVIADAIAKGIKGFDYELALKAMIASQEQLTNDLISYRNNGFIPSDEATESVSKTLEYAYDDWCIAQVAKILGKTQEYNTYLVRAQSYKNIFDAASGCMRPRTNGAWRSPFDPREVDFNFTEANSWQYSFYVPQDINGLIALHGGTQNFALQLDKMFNDTSGTTGRQQSDITGLIGQYAHGNEPSHHAAYLYNFVGQAYKTQKIVRQIMNEMYSNKPDGLCGNEDCGQMSAWYVLSAAGFYPVTPGTNQYIIGCPLFDEVIFHLENGKTFTIKAKGAPDNMYIQSLKLNGKSYEKTYIQHQDLMAGGLLEFELGKKPSSWGSKLENCPQTKIIESNILSAPFLKSGIPTFYDSLQLEIVHPLKEVKLFYALNKSTNFIAYTLPISIQKNTEIKFFAQDVNGVKSAVISASFMKLQKGRTIKIKNPYSSQYHAGGDSALIDCRKGKANFNDGTWQGYQKVDLDVIIDLGKVQSIQNVGAGFLQNFGAWIWFPTEVIFYASIDGVNFTLISSQKNTLADNLPGTLINSFEAKITPRKMRYLKVVAKNRGYCPSWHPGYAYKGETWIFADEIWAE